MKNSTKRLLMATSLLSAIAMILSACNKTTEDGGSTTATTTAAQAEQTTAGGDSTEQTTAAETTTEATTAAVTVVPMPTLGGTIVYEALDDMKGYADPENLPGCLYPADQGNISEKGSGRLCNAGEIYAFLGEGGKGVGISNRKETWDSLDVTLGDLEPGAYTIQVKFTSSNPVWFAIENADSPWGALAKTDTEDVTEAILTFDFTLTEKGVWIDADGNKQNRFRLNATPEVNYYVENIRIYKQADPMPTLEGTIVYEALDDMKGYADPENLPGCLYPADQGNISANGSGRLCNAGEIYAFLGEGGKGVGISNRKETWDSLDVTLGDLDPGDYTIQVKFTSSSPVWFAIENADSPWGALTKTDTEDVTEATLTFDFTLTEKGVWIDADGNKQNRFRLNATPEVNYYVENIRIYKK